VTSQGNLPYKLLAQALAIKTPLNFYVNVLMPVLLIIEKDCNWYSD